MPRSQPQCIHSWRCGKYNYQKEGFKQMQKEQLKASQVMADKRNISRYTGLLYSRIVLLVCLLFLTIAVQPIPLYLFAFLLLCPWIFSNIPGKKSNSPQVLLTFCAKKYSYTPVRLTVEKYIGVCTILLLVAWQLLSPPATGSSILRLAPGFLLLLYLLCRILATAVTRRRIHRLYTELLLLA